MRASVWWTKYKGEDFPPVRGSLLWGARLELGLSQRAAADACGFRPWRIGAMERGDIWFEREEYDRIGRIYRALLKQKEAGDVQR